MADHITTPDDCNVVIPMTHLRVIYGLDANGGPTMYMKWLDGDGEETVDYFTKAGVIGFLQQCTTADFIDSIHEDDD